MSAKWPDVAGWSSVPLKSFQPSFRLIEDGLAKACRLSPRLPNRELTGMPSEEEIRDSYYWVTEAGIDLQTRDCEFWPFDDEGALRQNWVPPTT